MYFSRYFCANVQVGKEKKKVIHLLSANKLVGGLFLFLDIYLSSFCAFWRTGCLAKRTFLGLKLNIYLFYIGLCGNIDIISRATAAHNWTFGVLVVNIEIALSSGFCVFLEL